MIRKLTTQRETFISSADTLFRRTAQIVGGAFYEFLCMITSHRTNDETVTSRPCDLQIKTLNRGRYEKRMRFLVSKE